MGDSFQQTTSCAEGRPKIIFSSGSSPHKSILTVGTSKVNTIAQIRSGKDLHLLDADEVAYQANNVAKRDEVFTQIVGYSNVRWQVVG